MKKETVYAFLDRKEQETRKIKDEQVRQSLLAAINECRTWVERPWADMYQPTAEKVKMMKQEAEVLAKKKQQEPLSEAEQARLAELNTLYEVVYQPFGQKIGPTVRRARAERSEQARRKDEQHLRSSKGGAS